MSPTASHDCRVSIRRASIPIRVAIASHVAGNAIASSMSWIAYAVTSAMGPVMVRP